MARTFDLLDVNVWLALSLPDHPHHPRARRYWFEEAGDELVFSRVTALAYVRLCTQPRVMAGEPLSVAGAWQAYRSFRALPDVALVAEPRETESLLGAWAAAGRFKARLWTDAYLAAFARAGGLRLVTFDRDFTRFVEEELDLLLLDG